jgi:hypothetical protein
LWNISIDRGQPPCRPLFDECERLFCGLLQLSAHRRLGLVRPAFEDRGGDRDVSYG